MPTVPTYERIAFESTLKITFFRRVKTHRSPSDALAFFEQIKAMI